MGPGVRATVDDATGRQFAPVKLMALGVLGTTKKSGAGNELTNGGARATTSSASSRHRTRARSGTRGRR
jgi:hypothetical protein